MKNLNKNIEIWFYIAPFTLIWMIIVQTAKITTILSLETVKKIPDAVMYATVFHALFSKYMWKYKIFKKWLVPYPNLQGTWIGTLESTWIDPNTNKRVTPIPVQFCIRQDFETINVTMYTKESSSFSQAARFEQENDSTVALTYTYSNKPQASIRHRSEIHDGAAHLRVTGSATLALEGEYWTSRKTTGDVHVKMYSNKLINCFDETINVG